jgi:hypothetical protein
MEIKLHVFHGLPLLFLCSVFASEQTARDLLNDRGNTDNVSVASMGLENLRSVQDVRFL